MTHTGQPESGAEPTVAPTDKDNEEEDDVPDPEEDNLDDLDDILDEFSSTGIDKSQNVRLKSSGQLSSHDNPNVVAPDVGGDIFARELQDQMAAFMGSMDESPEMKQELESMMKQLGSAIDPGPSSKPVSASQAGRESSNHEEPFQETIRKTMERMQASDDQAGAAARSEGSDDILSQIFKDMQTGGLPGDSDEEGFNKMLLGMMQQLTNREILYEPMKELHDKFPSWMEKNRANTKADDMKRYEEQQRLVREIVEKFDENGYADSKSSDREFIVDRMQQMQAAGNPPADLVGGMDAAEALSDTDPSCPQQ